jgi:hypothetical protein
MALFKNGSRIMVWLACASAALVSAPVRAWAQVGSDPASCTFLSIGMGVGVGTGPTQTLTLDVQVVQDLEGPLRLKVELGRATQGVGTTCEDAWPSSYACSARPLKVLAGPGVTRLIGGRTTILAEVLGGLQRMDRGACCGTAPALQAGGGVETRIGSGSRWVTGLGGYWLTAFNSEYRELMGQRPRYMILSAVIRYGIP